MDFTLIKFEKGNPIPTGRISRRVVVDANRMRPQNGFYLQCEKLRKDSNKGTSQKDSLHCRFRCSY